VDGDRIDVRRQPLVVRDGCAPDRTPAGRWPSDGVLVRSEQFAVNEAMACLAAGGGESGGGGGSAGGGGSGSGGGSMAGPAVFGMHAPPGTGIAEVFGDLVAAVVTERARRLADLPDPAAAFGEVLTWGSHRVAAPARALAGFEMVQSAPGEKTPWTVLGLPEGKPGAAVRLTAERAGGVARAGLALPPVGTRWRDRAARADYFASTARLSDGVGAWAMLVARLGDRAANRAFAERWWHGAVRGTDVLFPAGESMASALRQIKSKAVDWPSAVTWFRSALGKVHQLAAERMLVAAALSRLSVLEQACEEASCAAEAAQAQLEELTAREPAARHAVTVAEEEYRAALAGLGAHELGRPEMTTVTPVGVAALRSRGALTVALAGGLRRGRNWRNWSAERRAQRVACAAAERRLDTALREAEALRGGVAAARTAAAAGTAEVARLTAEIEPLAERVAAARQQWGDHVPAGPSQAETEDPALIEWRETTAPWMDAEYAAARAQAFMAALELHKALIAAQSEVFQANLAALMEYIGMEAGPSDEAAPAEVLLAAWQSFFLAVPVVHVPFEAAGTLLDGLGPGSLGWLLADCVGHLPADQLPSLLRCFERAVLAGDTLLTAGPPSDGDSGDGESGDHEPGDGAEPSGDAGHAGIRKSGGTPAPDRYGTWLRAGASDGDAPRWVGMPLRVVRGQDRPTVDLRNNLAYDGLLIAGRDNPPANGRQPAGQEPSGLPISRT
jgi:hypothetical protein